VNYARIAIAKSLEDAAPSTELEDGSKFCPLFDAEIAIFEKFLTGAPTSGTLRPIPTETVKVFNTGDTAVSVGDFVAIGQMVDETWVVFKGDVGSGTEICIFQILEDGGYGPTEALTDACEDKLRDAYMSYEAQVLWRPCGIPRVSEETDDGTIIVWDELESFLNDRENSEAQGKIGVAAYLKEEGGYVCKWVITFIDWWREIQVITDVIVNASEIRFKVKRIKVWDDCELPDIVIPLIDCEDPYA
jgi:hypothetical protein